MDLKSKLKGIKNSLKSKSNHFENQDESWVILKLDAENNWRPIGPLTKTEVKDKLKSGDFRPTDFCWISGWKDWKKIYEESAFFLTQKPPITLSEKTDTRSNNFDFYGSEFKDSLANSLSEVPLKISPLQYLGWKYKKKLKANDTLVEIENRFENHNFNRNSCQNGVLNNRRANMPEPWDYETKKLDSDKSELSFFEDVNSSFGHESHAFDKNFSIKKNWILTLCFMTFGLVIFSGYKSIQNLVLKEGIDLNLSYFVIEDFTSDLPKYMYARSDLKKGQPVKVRLFNAQGKRVRTQNLKAGLNLVSQGTGRIRIPLYPYKLTAGVYLLKIEIEGQTLEKEFVLAYD